MIRFVFMPDNVLIKMPHFNMDKVWINIFFYLTRKIWIVITIMIIMILASYINMKLLKTIENKSNNIHMIVKIIL